MAWRQVELNGIIAHAADGLSRMTGEMAAFGPVIWLRQALERRRLSRLSQVGYQHCAGNRSRLHEYVFFRLKVTLGMVSSQCARPRRRRLRCPRRRFTRCPSELQRREPAVYCPVGAKGGMRLVCAARAKATSKENPPVRTLAFAALATARPQKPPPMVHQARETARRPRVAAGASPCVLQRCVVNARRHWWCQQAVWLGSAHMPAAHTCRSPYRFS